MWEAWKGGKWRRGSERFQTHQTMFIAPGSPVRQNPRARVRTAVNGDTKEIRINKRWWGHQSDFRFKKGGRW